MSLANHQGDKRDFPKLRKMAKQHSYKIQINSWGIFSGSNREHATNGIIIRDDR